MFELAKQPVKITGVNLRSELHGDEHVPAVDVSVAFVAANDLLTMFSSALRATLFAKADKTSGAPPAEAREAQGAWKCFHCDETFTDREAAAEHFGQSEAQQPACQIDIAEYRRMEETNRRHCEEDTDLHRQIHRLEAEHQVAQRRAEEEGYAKGLRDAAPPVAQEAVAWQGVYDPTELYYRKPSQADVRPLFAAPVASRVRAEPSLMNVRHLWGEATEQTGGDGLEAMQCFARLVLVRYGAQPRDGRPHSTMDDAIAAGDGTLHGAIDYWQSRSTELAGALQELLTAVQRSTCDGSGPAQDRALRALKDQP